MRDRKVDTGLISVFVAFGAGIVSFVSPCVLPLVPAYLAYLAGSEGKPSDRRGKVLRHAAVFVLGFSLVFTLLWVAIGLVGFVFADFALRLKQMGGLMLLALGLFMAGLVPLPKLWQERRFSPQLKSSISYGRSFLVGSFFAAGWTPCIGPVLAGIIGLATLRDSVWQGAYLLVAYSLGLGVPFMLSAVALDRVRKLSQPLVRHHQAVAYVSGAFLILVGMLMLSGTFTELSRLANRVQLL